MQSPWFEKNTPQLSFFSLFITTVQELSTEALLRQNCCCNMPDFYIQSRATQTLPDLVRARDPWAHEHCSGWVWSSAPLSSLAGQRRAAVGVSDYDKQQWFSRLIRTLTHLVKTFTQFLDNSHEPQVPHFNPQDCKQPAGTQVPICPLECRKERDREPKVYPLLPPNT